MKKYTDIIKIFTVLNGFSEPCWRLLLLINSSRGRFRFTSISLRTGLANRQSLTNLETELQVELQMTGLFALLKQTNLLTLNALTSYTNYYTTTFTDILFRHITGTGQFTKI